MRRARALGLSALVFLAVGCGNGGGATRAEWAREADAVCAEYNRRFDALGSVEELPQLARLLEKAVILLEEERVELSRVDAPEADRPRIQRMLASLGEAGAAATQAREAARRGDEEAVMVAIGESESAASQASHIARDLGARACAQP